VTFHIPVPTLTSVDGVAHDREIRNSLMKIREVLSTRFSGSFRIEGALSFHDVVFSEEGLPDQVDDQYMVLLCPTDETAVDFDPFLVREVTRYVDGFRVRVWNPPGTSRWVDWSWKLLGSGIDPQSELCNANTGAKEVRSITGAIIPVPKHTSMKGEHMHREIKLSVDAIRNFIFSEYNGMLTMTETNTAKTVVFADEGLPDQVDTNYDVFFVVIKAAAAAPGVALMKSCVKTTTGFTVEFLSFPGLGKTQDWAWKLFRNI